MAFKSLRNMPYVVDLRSDTLTKPTEAMKHAMVNSAVGDDVHGEDPTVKALEMKIAALLGKQAALFVPSGTMANLIAIMVHCNKRGSEAIVGDCSYIYKHQQGGAAHIAGVRLTALENSDDGTFDLDELEGEIKGKEPHEVLTSLVAVENTHSVCGGQVLPLYFLDDLAELCKKYSLPIHMDGARLFNAAEYSEETPARLVQDCDSVSVCFSKGLSAPVGSALVGSYHFIEQARRVRLILGGSMRQAGVLAAAAIVALDEVVPLLHLDHKRAQTLAKAIDDMNLRIFSVYVRGVQTNMVLLRISEESSVTAEMLMQRLAQVSLAETQGDCKTPNGEGIIVKAICFNIVQNICFSKKRVRLTLHREISDEDLRLAIMKIRFVLQELQTTEWLQS